MVAPNDSGLSRRVLFPLTAMRNAIARVFALAALATSSADAEMLGLERVARGLHRPVFMTHAPGDPDRLFIVRQDGMINLLDLRTNTLQAQPFLYVSDTIYPVEAGLVGMAFHPDYQNNGKFYVYTAIDNGGKWVDGVESTLSAVVREYHVSADNPNRADISFRPILEVPRTNPTHLAGWIGFSPIDNQLYITSGDGGLEWDYGPGHTEPTGNAQDITDNFLGKILRIDINGDDFPDDSDRNYSIPADNPFVGVEGDDEIWAYGLRNPYRASFDRATGDMWIGDVGQGRREEINFIPANSGGGQNFGWRLREGSAASAQLGGPRPPGAIDPVYEYLHDNSETGGRCVFGGYVYRGPDPALQGKYFFGDAETYKLWMLDPADIPSSPDDPPLKATRIDGLLPPDVGDLFYPVSFGEDLAGNLYLAYFFSQAVYKINTAAIPPGDFNSDLIVDYHDMMLWTENFGAEEAAGRSSGDADGDGDIDGHDFLAWQRAAGTSVEPWSIAVPEPGAVRLLALAWAVAAAGARATRRG